MYGVILVVNCYVHIPNKSIMFNACIFIIHDHSVEHSMADSAKTVPQPLQ